MSAPVNESFIKSLILGLIPVIVGTFIFGVIIESYKSNLNFRSDIMKEYYLPLITKERQCSRISNTFSDDYNQKASLYHEIFNRYNATKDGSGPKLTEEYKSYLIDLVKQSIEYNKNSKMHYQELMLCRQELQQNFINIALVTGTLDQFNTYNNKLNKSLNTLDVENKQKSDEVKKALEGVDINNIVTEFFISDDLTDNRFSSKYIDEAIKKETPLISFFTFKADIETKVNNNYLELYSSYNTILEKEISSRYKRNWLSKLLG